MPNDTAMPLFASAIPSLWPFAVLLICLGAIVLLITVLRVHAFPALILAAILAGLLATKLPGERGTLPHAPHKERSHWIQAVELTTEEFGATAGKIGVVIALAAVIGMCLMESGAADKVVRRFLAAFGEKRAGGAIVASSYVLSIPIFFDTFFMLLVPLARAMRVRTGKNYLLYILAICCGGTITHSLVAPHPGPLAMAENLHLDLGLTIVVGWLAGLLPLGCAWLVSKWINARLDVPMRETPGASLADLEAIVGRDERELPSFLWSITPVVLPIFLIASASMLAAFGGRERFPALLPWVEFLGNRNIALLIGALAAMVLLMRQKGLSPRQVSELIGPPLSTAGVIILITSAGGAFGLMLRNAGVGEAIQGAVAGREVNLIFLSWFVAAVIRIAQGSATVAMLTTSAMIYGIIRDGPPLPYHPLYLFLAIGFGAKMLSWMNDSGFWVIGKLSGLTEAETLKSWTVLVSTISVVGLIECLIFSKLLPFV